MHLKDFLHAAHIQTVVDLGASSEPAYASERAECLQHPTLPSTSWLLYTPTNAEAQQLQSQQQMASP